MYDCTVFVLYTFFLSILRPLRSPLFPYTTLFRSRLGRRTGEGGRQDPGARVLRRDGADDRGAAHGHRGHQPHLAEEPRSEEHTSELQSHSDLVCRLLLEKKKKKTISIRENANEKT